MRFWGKGKQGDKKSSRDRLVCGADTLEGDYGDTGLLLGGKTGTVKYINISAIYFIYRCMCANVLNRLRRGSL